MIRIPRPTWLRYLVAVAVILAIGKLRKMLLQNHDAGWEGPPFTMMFAGVLLSAWFGGVGPGVVATLTAALVCDFYFMEPTGSLLGNKAGEDIRLLLFMLEGFAISWLIQALRRTTADSRAMERNLRLIAENTTDVIFAYDMSRQLLYVNPAFETLTGNSVNELRENPFMNYIHPHDSPRMVELFDGLFKGKYFKDVEYRIIAYDGEVKWCRGTWGPMLDEYGQQVGVQGRETDITESKRSEATLRFLADSSAILISGKAAQEMLELVAKAAVGQFADWCLIDLMENGGPIRTVAAAHADPSREPWVLELQRDFPPETEHRSWRGRVITTSTPLLEPEISSDMIASQASDNRHLKLMRNLAPRSALGVFFQGPGKVNGAITFIRSVPGRPYNPSDLVFASDLAERMTSAMRAFSSLQAQHASARS